MPCQQLPDLSELILLTWSALNHVNNSSTKGKNNQSSRSPSFLNIPFKQVFDLTLTYPHLIYLIGTNRDDSSDPSMGTRTKLPGYLPSFPNLPCKWLSDLTLTDPHLIYLIGTNGDDSSISGNKNQTSRSPSLWNLPCKWLSDLTLADPHIWSALMVMILPPVGTRTKLPGYRPSRTSPANDCLT